MSAISTGARRGETISVGRVLERHGTQMALIIAGCLAISALTLIYPSTPTYDPWAWILWGREIAHLDLVTEGGPSWKPFPIFFTVPFSFFGQDLAPYLWLWVARAGGLFGCVMAYRVAYRLERRPHLRGARRGLGVRGAPVLEQVRARRRARQLGADPRGRGAVGVRASSRRAPRPRALPRRRRRAAAPGGMAVPGALRPLAVVLRAAPADAARGVRRARARVLDPAGVVGSGRPAPRRLARQRAQPG